jgi:hypothetical protein
VTPFAHRGIAPLKGRESLLEPFDDHVVIRVTSEARMSLGEGSVVLHGDCFPQFVIGDLML